MRRKGGVDYINTMGRIPEPLSGKRYEEQLREMRRRHNLFWDEVKAGFLVPRLERRYKDSPRWFRRWAGREGKNVVIQITDMESDPLVVRFFPDRYELEVMEAPQAGVCFKIMIEKIALMNIGYGNLSPITAFFTGEMKVFPVFPLMDKLIFWRLLRG